MNDDRRQVDLRPTAASVRRTARNVTTLLSSAAKGAVIGAIAIALFEWMWRGDWGGGVNPLTWNDAARDDFFSGLVIGTMAGGAVGFAIGLWKRRRCSYA